MGPKFRGGSDDWLDDQDLKHSKSKRIKRKPKIEARSVGLPLDQANATVAEVFPNLCKVKLDGTSLELLCAYRRAEVVSKTKTEVRERTPVAVGDRVLVEKTGDDSGVVKGICERKNSLFRSAPGREGTEIHHVISANLDLLVIVASVSDPQFNPGLVDRFLVAAASENIPVFICITKMDLFNTSETPWEVYKTLGYSILEMSAKSDIGVQDLKQFILGKTVAFCGKSGVGKTSLLRKLLGSDIGKVAEISEATGKGKHTTTAAVLLNGPEGSFWIDTPGVREFGLAKVDPQDLGSYFPEFLNLSCTKNGCLHFDEEDCDAKSLYRYGSYQRLLASIL